MNIEEELLTEDNREILELLVGRLRLGKERYGHGLTIGHDTRDFGTKDDSWVEMNLEEILDGMIYMCAATLRLRREMQKRSGEKEGEAGGEKGGEAGGEKGGEAGDEKGGEKEGEKGGEKGGEKEGEAGGEKEGQTVITIDSGDGGGDGGGDGWTGGDISGPWAVETASHPMGRMTFETLSEVNGFNVANGSTYAIYCLDWLKRNGQEA